MNKLEKLKEEYDRLIDNDFIFIAHVFNGVYDFFNMHTIYKGKRVYHTRLIFGCITDVEDEQQIDKLRFVSYSTIVDNELVGDKKKLCEDILYYMNTTPVDIMLAEYSVLERKRKIKNIINQSS